MTKYVVTGGKPLHGAVTLHGAKNAGFKAMIAALLANSPSTICGLGLISEIDFAKATMASLGCKVTSLSDPHCLIVDPRNLHSFEISPELSLKSRFSPMYVGPLLAKFGQAILPIPGGDVVIGRRPINRQLDGLQALGAEVEFRDGAYCFRAKNGLVGTNFRFHKNTHNGTEILIMASCRAKGVTVIENAAAEPEIDDLIKFLNLMGAEISRVAPRTIRVIGKKNLSGTKHNIMKDRNEAVTYACAALATKGEVQINQADKSVLTAFLDKIREVGGEVNELDGSICFAWKKPLKATDVIAAPYPAFMTDWQPLWSTLMTQAQGESIVHETVYERRFDYVDGLVKMGAKIELFRPKVTNPDKIYNFNIEDDKPENMHAAKIVGPTTLTGAEIEVNDIRSGATALLAGLIGKGETTVTDPNDQIKRGYENLEEQLVSLGADIKIVSDI